MTYAIPLLVPKPIVPSLSLVPGSTLAGKYTLIRPIGIGGMGAVWLACNEATGAEVALKLLLPHPDDNPELTTRFRREAYTTARLCHRGIVRIYDLVEIDDGDCLVLVMELLRGQTLAAYLQQRGALDLEDALAIILPILAALSYAHDAGIVHRDLKPDNIFLAVDPDGIVTPKILDFGISKVRQPKAPIITRDGEMLGTPSYMSPEQVRGKSVGAESDIFNLGILLYEMLSGKNPFSGEGLHSMVVAILEETPAPIPGLGRDLWKIIERSLQKSPHARFASVAELAIAVRWAVGLPITPSTIPPELSTGHRRALQPASESSWGRPSRPRVVNVRRRRATIGALAVAVAVAVAATASMAWGSHAQPERVTVVPPPKTAVGMMAAVEQSTAFEPAPELSLSFSPEKTKKKARSMPPRPQRAGIARDPGF